MIAANWKENPVTPAEAKRLFDATARAAAKVPGADVLVCPPAIFLESLAARAKKAPKNLALGAQDIFWEDKGAYTGAVGPAMLRALGVRYAIVGHSERRRFFGETDEVVNRKVRAALEGGITPIMCVGEPAEVRGKGFATAQRYLARQLAYGLRGVAGKKVIVAYEPLWAIGSGKNDDPHDAARIAAFVKASAKAASRVLYGGSVNAGDVRDYVQLKEIDGALVGGASLKADEFRKLIIAAAGR